MVPARNRVKVVRTKGDSQMKFTRQQLNDMQRYLTDQGKLLGVNHTYPAEERTIQLLLVLVADARIDDGGMSTETKLDCIREEMDRFKNDTPYTAKQYSDMVMRVKEVLNEA